MRPSALTHIRAAALFAAALFAPGLAVAPAAAAGIVTQCNEAGLDAALSGGGTVTFSCGGPATITLTNQKTIAANTTIDGGGLVTLSGGGSTRLFDVPAGASLTLRRIALTAGNASGQVSGGAITNAGTLTLEDASITGSTATGAAPGSGGGGIFNSGSLTIRRSTLTGNSTPAAGSGAGGGAVASTSPSVSIADTTVTNNSGRNGGGLRLAGGIIDRSTIAFNTGQTGAGIFAGGGMTITNSTITDNISTQFSDTYFQNGGSLLLTNSTLDGSNPSGMHMINAVLNVKNSILSAACAFSGGSQITNGFNLTDSAGCGGVASVTASLGIAGLAANGGPTQTRALITGSPAIDAGSNADCPATDQRGVTRPRTAANLCDVGAYERDPSPPQIGVSLSPDAPDGADDWYTSDVTVTWTVTDTDSGIVSTSGCDTTVVDADTPSITLTCNAVNGSGIANQSSVTLKRDASGPNAVLSVASGTPGDNGWYLDDVLVQTLGSDPVSSPVSCSADQTIEEDTTGTAVHGSCTNEAGLTTDAAPLTIKRDATPPSGIAFEGAAIADGGTYVFGSVPAGPTGCTATDATSGIATCATSGYATTVGTHTIVATATDNAGNAAHATMSYTVEPWTPDGFFSPVQMGGPTVLNVVKSGQTVPLKFRIDGGSVEQTTIAAVDRVEVLAYECDAAAVDAPMDATAQGEAGLRYDESGRQFVFNWATPRGRGGWCYAVTMHTADGVSGLTAYFRLK